MRQAVTEAQDACDRLAKANTLVKPEEPEVN
jgi:hypothetical protein